MLIGITEVGPLRPVEQRKSVNRGVLILDERHQIGIVRPYCERSVEVEGVCRLENGGEACPCRRNTVVGPIEQGKTATKLLLDREIRVPRGRVQSSREAATSVQWYPCPGTSKSVDSPHSHSYERVLLMTCKSARPWRTRVQSSLEGCAARPSRYWQDGVAVSHTCKESSFADSRSVGPRHR